MAWGSPLDRTDGSSGGGGGGLDPGVELADNTASALDVGEGATSYITIDTVNGLERIDVLKDAHIVSTADFFVDVISEETAAAGVTIDGVLLKDATVTTATIIEGSAGSGVTIDGVLLKDERWEASGAAISSGDAGVVMKDNLANAFFFSETGFGSYLVFRTTNSAERAEFNSDTICFKNLDVLDNVTNGDPRRVGGFAYRNAAASTAIAGNQENEAVFDTQFEMEPNTLKADTVLRLKVRGVCTAITAAQTCVIRIKADNTTISSCGTFTGGTTLNANDWFEIEFEMQCRTAGAAGTVVGSGTWISGAPGATPTTTRLLTSGTAGTPTVVVDTTTTLTIGISMDWQAAADDTNSCRLEGMSVEIVG
jgi:hypothetical protein